MVDIHSHILPGLDDGAETLEEAVQIAETAVASEIYHMAATSHGNIYPYTLEEYRRSFEQLQNTLIERKIRLKLYSGMEIFLNEDAFERLNKGELLTLNKTDYLLVEVDFEEWTANVIRWIEKLRERGYRVILAHPERYMFLQRDPELAYYLGEQGCVLQLNAGSIAGDFGRNCEELSWQFLRNGIVGAVATDTHDRRYRSPDIRKVARLLAQELGSMETKLLLSENPSRILKGYNILHREYEEGNED